MKKGRRGSVGKGLACARARKYEQESDSGICKALGTAGGQKHGEGQEAGCEREPWRDFKQGSDMARSGFWKDCFGI